MAGYDSAGSGMTRVNLTTATVVPRIRKCSRQNNAVTPSVAAFNARSGVSAVGMFVGCQNGKARYFPIFDVDGAVKQYRALAARPGDKLVLHVDWTSTSASVSLVDKTHPGVSKTLMGPGSSSFTGASVGESVAPKDPPIPDFGSERFSKSILNGKALGVAPHLERFNMVNASSVLQIKTGPIASNNESFTTTFKHS